jgi:seryl-tRNA synthetase
MSGSIPELRQRRTELLGKLAQVQTLRNKVLEKWSKDKSATNTAAVHAVYQELQAVQAELREVEKKLGSPNLPGR